MPPRPPHTRMRDVELEAIIPPIRFRLDGADVVVHEVFPVRLIDGSTRYGVCVHVEYRGRRSGRFTLFVRRWDELVKKLLVEIPKFKLMAIVGGEA